MERTRAMHIAIPSLRQEFESPSRYYEYYEIAGVAQLVERRPSKSEVAGSYPVSRSYKQEVLKVFYPRLNMDRFKKFPPNGKSIWNHERKILPSPS